MKPSTWATCTSTARMLDSLRWRASDRKLRLFACACVRSVGHLLLDEESRSAVDAAERLADGLADAEALSVSRRLAEGAAAQAWALWDGGTPQAEEAAAAAAGLNATLAAARAAEYASAAAQAEADGDPSAWKAEQRRQCGLLRDLFDDLFGEASPISIWRDAGVVAAVARTIYEQGRFEELPVLADALEDAGCADLAFLGHLRGPGPHARGCWALDLVPGARAEVGTTDRDRSDT